MFEPLRCPDCDWKSKPKHKRSKQALTQHRQRAHPNGGVHSTIQSAVDALPEGGTIVVAPGTYREQVEIRTSGYLVILASGEEVHVPAEECQETIDRYWFFRNGAPLSAYKRVDVREVVKV